MTKVQNRGYGDKSHNVTQILHNGDVAAY